MPKHKTRPGLVKKKPTNRKQKYAQWVAQSERWRAIKTAYFKTVSYKNCEVCSVEKIDVHHRAGFAYILFGPSVLSAIIWWFLKAVPPVKWILLRLYFIMLCPNHHKECHAFQRRTHLPLFVASLIYVPYARVTNMLRSLKELGVIAAEAALLIGVIWSVSHFGLFR